MATIRQIPRSPFWQLRYRDTDTGQWREKSTGLTDARAAQRMADRATAVEKRLFAERIDRADFRAWVPGYLDSHWPKGSQSRRRYTTAWQAIKPFLATQGIVYPRQLKYQHGQAYIEWRQAHPVHGRAVSRNTALLEVKFLAQLVNEAIRREFCESNPLSRLGVARTAPKLKPELTDAQITTLRTALAKQPEWMRIAFEISLYTGCRFSECEIPIANIDFAAGTIRLRDAKRNENDPRKYFTVPIHERLRPLLQSLQVQGRIVTVNLSRDFNGRINKFFRSAGVNASFHSLRVTFVTRCHRGGLSESQAMRMTNHSSMLVHRIYSRLNVDDVRKFQAQIPLP